jgi:hypothetical protein
MPATRFITTQQLKAIATHYPEGGSFACRASLPGWSDAKIQKMAWVYGITCKKTRLELIAMRKAREKQMLDRVAEQLTDRVPLELLHEFKSYVEGIKA